MLPQLLTVKTLKPDPSCPVKSSIVNSFSQSKQDGPTWPNLTQTLDEKTRINPPDEALQGKWWKLVEVVTRHG